MYPADLLIYYISAAVILLASLPMTVNVSLPHNNTGRASVLYNLAAIHFPSATCTNPVNSELHVIHQSALQCNWRRWMQCVHFLTAVCYIQQYCPEACLQAHYAVSVPILLYCAQDSNAVTACQAVRKCSATQLWKHLMSQQYCVPRTQ